jgi:hypothetical protein
MKLVKSYSRWGNAYKVRYYFDGKRISEREYNLTRDTLQKSCAVTRTDEKTSFGYRLTIRDCN